MVGIVLAAFLIATSAIVGSCLDLETSVLSSGQMYFTYPCRNLLHWQRGYESRRQRRRLEQVCRGRYLKHAYSQVNREEPIDAPSQQHLPPSQQHGSDICASFVQEAASACSSLRPASELQPASLQQPAMMGCSQGRVGGDWCKNGFKKQSTKPRGRLPILLPTNGPPAPGHLPCFYRLAPMYRLSSEHQNISHPQIPRTDLRLPI